MAAELRPTAIARAFAVHAAPAEVLERGRAAFVLTVSDRVSAGARSDQSGPVVAVRLEKAGFSVDRGLVADDRKQIATAVRGATRAHALVITTGGTGLAPRDVTPQALRDLLDYEVPGFGEAMRAEGRRSTPFASLSRSLAGVVGQTLVIAIPGSPRAAIESLEAVIPLLDHALETILEERAGHTGESGPSLAGAGTGAVGSVTRTSERAGHTHKAT